MVPENGEIVLSREYSLLMMRGLPISNEESLRKRDEIIEAFNANCKVERKEGRVYVELPNWELFGRCIT